MYPCVAKYGPKVALKPFTDHGLLVTRMRAFGTPVARILSAST